MSRNLIRRQEFKGEVRSPSTLDHQTPGNQITDRVHTSQVY